MDRLPEPHVLTGAFDRDLVDELIVFVERNDDDVAAAVAVVDLPFVLMPADAVDLEEVGQRGAADPGGLAAVETLQIDFKAHSHSPVDVGAFHNCVKAWSKTPSDSNSSQTYVSTSCPRSHQN